MKIVKKLLILCFALLMVGGMFIGLKNKPVLAEIANSQSYYYAQLNASGKKFYNALKKMNDDGDFKAGKSFDLIKNEVVTKDEVKAYQNGNSELLKAFGAGRDAFYLDNPELFYIDFDQVSLSFATKGNDYIANIDAGRSGSYYAEGFSSEAQIETACGELRDKLQSLSATLGTLTTNKEKVAKANELICSDATYSFEADGTDLGKGQIRTSYGALIKGYAVCEGYARAFKTLMDLEGIRCVIVVGYVYNSDGGLEPHAWNYVELDNKWYLVDSTYNDSANSINEYLLLGSENTAEYVESKTISNSGFEFKYPTLATFNYGMEEIKTGVTYDKSRDTYYQDITYSYKNYTSAKAMQQNGLYLIAKHEIFDKNGEYTGWGQAFALYPYEPENNVFSCNSNVFSTQLFVTSQAPDSTGIYSNLQEDLILAKSDIIINEAFNEQANTPRVSSTSPASTTVLNPENVYEIAITYDMNLKKKDASQDIGVFVWNEKSSNLNDYVKVENVQISNNDTVKFTFTPSKMYEHDLLAYRFALVNIVGVNDLEPKYASLTFARPWAVCSKIYNDGRLYIDAIAEPTLIDNSDLSMTGFLDKDGNQVAKDQRSQLVLVAKKPSEALGEQMEDSAKDLLESGSFEGSSTYEIDLHICGGVATIPSGSYVKVAFGFPEGYGPKDKGVTFKVYHFKKDANGNIDPSKTEELTCVVTEYGIVVTVTDFSPFMVVAVKNEDVKTKNIYAKNINLGGSVSVKKDDVLQTEVVSLKEGESVTYEITTDEAYKLDYVLLNKKLIEVKDNKITLSYSDLEENNEIKFAYVSEEVYENEQQNGISSLNNSFLQNEQTDNVSIAKVVMLIVLAVLIICMLALLSKQKNKKIKK